jgi:hypothetical protein
MPETNAEIGVEAQFVPFEVKTLPEAPGAIGVNPVPPELPA